MSSTRACVAAIVTGLAALGLVFGSHWWPALVWFALSSMSACVVLFVIAVLTPPAPVMCPDCQHRRVL